MLIELYLTKKQLKTVAKGEVISVYRKGNEYRIGGKGSSGEIEKLEEKKKAIDERLMKLIGLKCSQKQCAGRVFKNRMSLAIHIYKAHGEGKDKPTLPILKNRIKDKVD